MQGWWTRARKTERAITRHGGGYLAKKLMKDVSYAQRWLPFHCTNDVISQCMVSMDCSR